MNGIAKKAATAGVGVITASAIAFAPSVQPPPPPAPAIQRTARVQLAASFDPFSITDWLGRIVIPPSLGAPFPTPQFLPQVAPTSIGSSIKNIYNAVEPWVRYGFDIAAYAVGFIPYVGWLAPQITIFYNFGERIARSITFNIADLLDGKVTFTQGLTNVVIDTINSFISLANDQIAFWLPPLPPIPPLPGGSTFAVSNTPPLPQMLQTVEKQTTAPLVGTGVTDLNPAGVLPGVTMTMPAVKPSPLTETSNLVRKIDPFSIATSAVSKAHESTAASVNGNPVGDVIQAPIGTTTPLAGTSNPSAGNPSKGGLVGAIERVTDSLTGGISGAKRPAP